MDIEEIATGTWIRRGIAALCQLAYHRNAHFRVKKLDVPCAECSGQGYWMQGTTEIPCRADVHREPDNVDRMVMLIVSEIAEGYEGWRKNEMDSHLPSRPAFEVELADAVIRIADLAQSLGMDLAGAIIEKMAYNKDRPDHRISARTGKPGAKRF